MKPKTYANDEVEITFDLKKCMHSEHCWRELGSVFDPQKRPWIDPDGADAARIRDQVGRFQTGTTFFDWEGVKERSNGWIIM
jgi:uncharacterized Fe-S cluster protein YjdI